MEAPVSWRSEEQKCILFFATPRHSSVKPESGKSVPASPAYLSNRGPARSEKTRVRPEYRRGRLLRTTVSCRPSKNPAA
jgi:hypothetical protein